MSETRSFVLVLSTSLPFAGFLLFLGDRLITFLGRPALNFVSFIFHNDLAGRAVRRSPQAVPLSESALAYAGRGVQPRVVNVDDEVFAVRVKAVNASIVFELLNNVFADSGRI